MRQLVYCLCTYLLLAISLGARTPVGDRFFAEGKLEETKKDWQSAYELYAKALAEDPSDVAYGIAAARSRVQAFYAHVRAGQDLRSRRRLEEALAEFEKARSLDGGIAAINQEITTTREMMRRPAAAEDRGLTPMQKMNKERDERIDRIMEPPELSPTVRTPFTLNLLNESSKTFSKRSPNLPASPSCSIPNTSR